MIGGNLVRGHDKGVVGVVCSEELCSEGLCGRGCMQY